MLRAPSCVHRVASRGTREMFARTAAAAGACRGWSAAGPSFPSKGQRLFPGSLSGGNAGDCCCSAAPGSWFLLLLCRGLHLGDPGNRRCCCVQRQAAGATGSPHCCCCAAAPGSRGDCCCCAAPLRPASAHNTPRVHAITLLECLQLPASAAVQRQAAGCGCGGVRFELCSRV